MSLVLVEALRHKALRADKDRDDELLIAIGFAVAAFRAAFEEYDMPHGSTATESISY